MGMDISKLPSNSNASKKQVQPVTQAPVDKKVVKGKATIKKSEVRKFKDVFVAEDAGSVWDYLVHEMIIPTTKNLLVDLGQSFIERMILGGSGRVGNRGGNGGYRDYRSYSSTQPTPQYANTGRNISRFDYEDIVYPSANDANAVLDTMEHTIRRFGLVRVSDLYDISGLTAPHTAHHFGWTNLSRARVIPVRGGFSIELPKHAEIE